MTHRVRNHIAILLAVTLTWASFSTRAAGAAEPVTHDDVLVVTVLNQPTLSGKFPVAADGAIVFPLLGRVEAGGLPASEVEQKLRQLLADGYLKDPQVSLIVERAKPSLVYVMGEVRQAGTYPVTEHMTVLDALARAGSTTEHAGAVVVVSRSSRPSDGQPAVNSNPSPGVTRVKLNALHLGAAQNPVLYPGDTVFVPRADTVYVFGAVKSPGNYAIDDQTTVIQALALAGGLTDRGSTRRIRIVHQSDPRKRQIKVKLSQIVQPSDTIVVGEGLF